MLFKALIGLQLPFAAVNRIYEPALYLLQVGFRYIAIKQIYPCRSDNGTAVLIVLEGYELYALHGSVRALIILSGQILCGKGRNSILRQVEEYILGSRI